MVTDRRTNHPQNNNHVHNDHRYDAHSVAARTQMWTAVSLTLGLFAFEYLGGSVTNSISLQADSWHVLFDAAAMLTAQAGLLLERRRPRVSALLVMLNGLTLTGTSVVIVSKSLLRFGTVPSINGKMGFFIAVLSLVVNLFIVTRLGHHHHNLNIKAALYHVIGDTCFSLATVVSTAVIWGFNLTELDALTGLLIGIGLCFGGILIAKKALTIIVNPPFQSVPLKEFYRQQ